MIAAGEAAAGGHGRIEPAHLLIGVLSLGKLGQVDDAGVGVNAAIVRDEHGGSSRRSRSGLTDPLRRRARAQLAGPSPAPALSALADLQGRLRRGETAGEDRPSASPTSRRPRGGRRRGDDADHPAGRGGRAAAPPARRAARRRSARDVTPPSWPACPPRRPRSTVLAAT
jgi:hypothetical protein